MPEIHEHDVAQDEQHEASENATKLDKDIAPRYSRRERQQPKQLTITALSRVRNDDEPTTRTVLMDIDEKERRAALDSEVNTLQSMNCWEVVYIPKTTKMMHTKFVLKRKPGERDEITRYKAVWLMWQRGECISRKSVCICCRFYCY